MNAEDDKRKAVEDYESVKRDQDDLLVLLTDQDAKLKTYRDRLRELGEKVSLSLPPASAVEVIETELSVCLCVSVCPCVNTLTAELIDVQSQTLVQGLTLMTSRTSSMFTVIGQRSRSSS